MDEQTDVRVENHGSLFLFHLQNDEVKEWISENVHIEGYMWQSDNVFACEHRYAGALIEGIEENGFATQTSMVESVQG